MSKSRAMIEYCDNPTCDTHYIVFENEPSPGYRFKGGSWEVGGGGPIPAFYACSEDCIVPAMKQVIYRSQN